MSDNKGTKEITRRGFIKGAAIGAGAISLAGLNVKGVDAAPPPKKWDKEVDVVVVGAGGAGLMAAIEAKDAKASVLVLEKAPTVRLSATNICGGGFSAAGTKIQKEQGIKDTTDLYYADMMAYGQNQNLPEMVRLVADKSGETFDILTGWGLETKPEYYGGHSVKRFHRNKSGTGKEYMDVLTKVAEKKNVSISLNTRVTGLFVDCATGRVLGVETEKKTRIKARKAVVLATSGYGGDPSLIDEYMPRLMGSMTGASPVSTGDGLKMAIKSGSTVSHIDGAGYYPAGFAESDRRGMFFRWYNFTASGSIIVNKKGMRFADEDTSSTYLTDELAKQPDKLMFTIADQTIWQKTLSITTPCVIGWTNETFQQEADKGVLITKADTVDALASKAGIDVRNVKDTLAKYNRYVDSGADPDFGRKKEKLILKIEKPPFYSIPAKPIIMLCTGGLRVNTKIQVLDPYHVPITGLYAAGEVACGPLGAYYMGGCNIAWAFVSGRVAGSNAAAEKPWK
jgi:fumarate reductase flavoprotein subunit